jgi:hypothetical protein
MKKLIAVLVSALLLASGMIAGQLLPGRADAHQPEAQEPEAQPPDAMFTECAAVTMYVNAGRSINAGREPVNTLRVPEGWTPVGGTTRGGEPTLLLCR